MTIPSLISHRERIFVRHATLLNVLADKKVTQVALVNALLAANNGDCNVITVGKSSAAVDTRKHCYSQLNNPYFAFRMHSGFILSQDCCHLLYFYLWFILYARQNITILLETFKLIW